MFEFIRKFLPRKAEATGEKSVEEQFDSRHTAAAALLVEAAWLDSEFAAEERDMIVRLVAENFRLPAAKAQALVSHAERQQGEAYSGWQFIKTVREGFGPDERTQVVEMLWKVAYADGTLRPFEKQMVERVGEELDLPVASIEAARHRAAGEPTA